MQIHYLTVLQLRNLDELSWVLHFGILEHQGVTWTLMKRLQKDPKRSQVVGRIKFLGVVGLGSPVAGLLQIKDLSLLLEMLICSLYLGPYISKPARSVKFSCWNLADFLFFPLCLLPPTRETRPRSKNIGMN